jgi:hypothetical protein
MHASRRLTSQAWAKYNVTSYAYLFNVLVNGVPNSIGSAHFQEVAFVFDNTNGVGYQQHLLPNPLGGEPKSYTELATLMTRMWAGFIYGGDPNLSGGKYSFRDLWTVHFANRWIVPAATWSTYTLDNPQTFVFDANVTSYAAPDTFRAEGINWMIQNMVTEFGRWSSIQWNNETNEEMKTCQRFCNLLKLK